MFKNRTSYRLCFVAVLVLFLHLGAVSKTTAEPRFIFKPSFVLSEIYDDNLIPGSAPKEWDFYTSVEPSFKGQLFLRIAELNFGYHPAFLIFPRHLGDKMIKEILQNADFEAKTEFSSGLILKVRDRFDTLPFSYKISAFTPSNLSQSNEISTSAEYQGELSKTANMNFKGEFVRFDASGNANDGMRMSFESAVNKDFSSTLTIGIENRLSKYYYDNITGNPLIWGLGVKPVINLTGRIKASLPFGYRLLNISGVGTQHSLSYNLEFGYDDGAQTTAALFFTQEFLIDVQGNSFDRRSFGAKIDEKITDKLKVYLSTSFATFDDKASQGNANDSVLEINPGFSYQVARDFSLDVGYNGYYNKWGTGNSNFITNRFFISIKYEKRSDEEI